MMECRVWVGAGDCGTNVWGFSHESEHDLALMVSDFLENGGSAGADSWCSSDSDSGLSDLHHLADKISIWKLVETASKFNNCCICSHISIKISFPNFSSMFSSHSVPQFESDVLSVVHSRLLSINSTDLHLVKSGPCNASCIRFSLVKLLRLSGYDAAVCASKWQGSGKVPGGDHEYIDVVNHKGGGSERLIIDIDFRSHFEIARAVDSYERILKLLPVVYVGSLSGLKQFLPVMVEAARSSLKQNSMPLPPWRSLAYLQAKWHSPYNRLFTPDGPDTTSCNVFDHKQCTGHLHGLQSVLQSEISSERLLKPINNESNWKLKLDRRRHASLRAV